MTSPLFPPRPSWSSDASAPLLFYTRSGAPTSKNPSRSPLPLSLSLSGEISDGGMEDDFTRAVGDGLRLAKRIYGGKDLLPVTPPRPAGGMERPATSLLPTAPMVYAVIGDPAIVDNPDVPSYQPHVHGRCDRPALIPLQMKGVAVEVDCHLDTAFVAVAGRWRVHCVMPSRRCDCRLVVPMGEQGSILGIEVDVGSRSYYTRMVKREEDQKSEKIAKSEDGGYLKPQLFFLTIPQVDGGCDIALKVRWSQKLLYKDDEFSISIPFNFPQFVSPFSKTSSKREKIELNINSGTGKELLCQRMSHPMKEKGRHEGKSAFLYEADVANWSNKDFHFSYSVYSSDLFGGLLLESSSMYGYNQSDMFCFYLFPGNSPSRKVFRKEVVFIVDISGSMQGKPLENVKNALFTALLELSPADYFDIIAFNEEMYLFSSSLEPATEDIIENATQWMSKIFVAEGGTNIMNPLNEAMHLLSNTRDALPHIYLITDGSVEDERNICSAMRTHSVSKGGMSPRIFTFGIGLFCNHYFLRMLALMGRGQYDAAYDPDSIEDRMIGWLRKASSPIVANLTINISDHLDAVEMYPFHIPDLSVGCPLLISGRFQGKFLDSLKAKGCLADMSDIVIDLKVQNVKDIPLEKVFAKQHIDQLTAEAWFSENKQFEEKVSKLSIHSAISSEYTYMVLLQSETERQDTVKQPQQYEQQKQTGTKENVIKPVRGVNLGFGNITATANNLPAGFGEPKQPQTPDVFDKAVGCCSRLCDCCCCMCCIQFCSKLNDQCMLVLTQLCTALSCFACVECCAELCS